MYILKRILLGFFDFLKLVPYTLSGLFIKSSEISSEKDSLLMLKLDEIGDYILFRNFLKEIRNSKKFSDFKISICGNIIWKDLAEYLDRSYLDEFIWINKKRFLNEFTYRRGLKKLIKSDKFNYVINASYSRSFFLDDTIIKWTNPAIKIGFETDLSNSFFWQKLISDRYYNDLINSETVRFEFNKNKLFYSKLLKNDIPIERPKIEIESNKKISDDDYLVFYMGGRRNYKRWAISNFVVVAKAVLKKYKCKVVIVGSDSDKKYSAEFLSLFQNSLNILDLTGTTKLTDLIAVLKNAKFVLSNDSGVAHISAAVNSKTIVLLNGTHFGRFFPYPKEMGLNVISIYPAEIENEKNSEIYLTKKFKYRSNLDINTIEPERIVDCIFNNL